MRASLAVALLLAVVAVHSDEMQEVAQEVINHITDDINLIIAQVGEDFRNVSAALEQDVAAIGSGDIHASVETIARNFLSSVKLIAGQVIGDLNKMSKDIADDLTDLVKALQNKTLAS